MKVIIAGSREINEYSIIVSAIQESNFDITEVVSGGARGVDSLAERYANENKITFKKFVAYWNDLDLPGVRVKTNNQGKKYNVLAGIWRNREMALYGDALIAIWDGKSRGTKNMIDEAKKKNLKIYIYHYGDENVRS